MSDAFGAVIAAQALEVPPALIRFHSNPPPHSHGVVTVEGGNRWARLLARLAGFPPPMTGQRFRLDVTPQGRGHVWRRVFGRHQTRSHLEYDPASGLVREHFGALQMDLALSAHQGVLRVSVERARLFGLPLPAALCPQSAAMEYQTSQGHLGFDISAQLPRIGLLLRYHGYIALPDLDLRR